jgi:hypothetical protein
MDKTLTILMACLACAAAAQTGPPAGRGAPGPVGATVTAGAFGILRAGLDGGGRMGFTLQDVAAAVMVRPTGSLAAGVAAEVDRIRFDFDGSALSDAGEPWEDVTILSLALPLSVQAWGGDLRVAPSVRWAQEDGASAGSARVVGGILSYTRERPGGLTLGLGAAVFSGLEDVWGFPFVAVRWQISDSLRLSNPSPLGPATPAGLELSWRFASRWELGTGACYRSERFRLDGDGPAPEGIGEWTGMPAWVRLAHRLGPLQVSAFVGAVFAGRLQVEDRDGARIGSERIDPAPLTGLAASVRF